MKQNCTLSNGGSAPATLGFNAVAPEWLFYGAADAAPAIPATESTLGSHPCVALSSAQLLPEWINRNLVGNRFAANGDNPLNFVSHARGSLQMFSLARALPSPTSAEGCPSLFGWFIGTMTRSDSSSPPFGLAPARTGLDLDWIEALWRSPGSRACCFSACAGSTTTQDRSDHSRFT